MNATGSRNKGNAFERLVCKTLSEWISYGEHRDLFLRNVGSGGSFTLSMQRGPGFGVPGDVMATAHPLAGQFIAKYMIEAKHWKALGLETALFSDTGEFRRIVKLAEKQAKQAKRHAMVIAKQNNRAAIVLLPAEVGVGIRAELRGILYHELWRSSTFACLLPDLLRMDPESFLAITAEVQPRFPTRR